PPHHRPDQDAAARQPGLRRRALDGGLGLVSGGGVRQRLGPTEDGAQGLPPGNVPLRPEGLPLLVREDPGRGATGSRRPAGTERRPVLSPRRPPAWSPSG